MSDVNGPKFSVNSLNYSGIQKLNSETPEVSPETTETLPQLTDFSDNKAEALGRSMLFKGIDNVNSDLKALMENPQIAENSDEIFEAITDTCLEIYNEGELIPVDEVLKKLMDVFCPSGSFAFG